MSTNPVIVKYLIAVLKWPSRLADQNQKALDVCTAINANPTLFPTPTPTTAAVLTARDLVIAAMAAVNNRTAKASARRNASAELLGLMRDSVLYVQKTANASPTFAAVIIEAAGLLVKVGSDRQAQVFAVKNGVSGQILLLAPVAEKRGFHEWQMQNPVTPNEIWVNLPSTQAARTQVNGLTPGETVAFRHRKVVLGVPGNWDSSISIIVI